MVDFQYFKFGFAQPGIFLVHNEMRWVIAAITTLDFKPKM